MGYLLKEALKTLCGVNQWSYAVFWKIGCQNPKLLIWEDCYYETASCSRLAGNLNPENAFHNLSTSWVSTESCDLQSSIQTADKVHFLVNKMMMDNQVNIVGEGLVGRVAFTGNHQWVLAENYFREAQPPEVQKEVCLQFAAGMQTVAVIPVLPHGVVQFGSSLTIIENMGFVNDVTSLLLQLGYLNELPKEHTPNTVISPPCSFDTFNYISNSAEPSMIDCQTNLVATKAEVFPSNSEMWSSLSLPSNMSSALLMPSQRTNLSSMYFSDEGNIYSKNPSSSALKNVIFDEKLKKNESSSAVKTELEHNAVQAFNIGSFVEDGNQKQNSGDDLFDVLGADFKNKLFNINNNEFSNNFPSVTNSRGNLESGIFSSTSSTDHLLEAVVSKIPKILHPAKRGLDDSISCSTNFTNISSSSEPNSCSLPYGRFGVPKFMVKAGSMSSGSFGVGPTKEESGTYSQGSSIFGSQLSSWISRDVKGKQASSLSTGYSKKIDEGSGKTGRKRLKPGENPRPRPKDRQMIQDRVKELREIVPNGAKCSIDSLLERTIKHMLFLQSVTKHADKLKQTGESKIISKDGGLLLKENFEGGATWAYEVGSQSMVCPIIVEDLNQPRQMLVEMLCEERGLFLEIADIIRGLGLTILKGVMETRKDKIWGRFAVEANRDVTRMEIFISLVRLLEQTAKKDSEKTRKMSEQFQQVAPIPVTTQSFQ
ncbi:basic helix-loop-helix (bHLH) DNA-bindingsuperfamily protein [Striga asiatica]|uniref:Basic helix-loop-helix (BHLH) DNA-bindingsuperfamily protein n=1 Tax=Striga asiatica TaxID=4170 RepID=A0A5A7PWL8_STRAF|nr:basic helix-loop-helix (bHLH) DNA-bindingsuperfamily protein [Striga asiatica]